MSLDKGDVVLLATPPAFRPIHLEYAVQKGVNVFMEKSFAVDGAGHPPRAEGGRGGHEEESQGRRRPDEAAITSRWKRHPASLTTA